MRRPAATVAAPLVVLLALVVGAALTAAALLVPSAPGAEPAVRGRALSSAVTGGAREAQVRALLDRRAAALTARDRAAFLATVDPAAGAFRARQAALFDALAGVPVTGWRYELDASRPAPASAPASAALDARYGTWWAPQVVLRYRLGPQRVPSADRQVLTLVPRDGGWLVAADDDLPGTERALWDRGPVEVARAPGVLVLGHRGRSGLLEELARTTSAVLPVVTRTWGPWAEQVVVLVPRDAAELGALARTDADLSALAALALGDRVVVVPEAFDGLSAAGRRVVLAHEVTHVAARAATGPHSPAWLVEGLADVVGHDGADLPLALAAGELAVEVRAGRVPAALPDAAALAPDAAGLAAAYEGAWLAVDLLVREHGAPAAVRLYRDLGAARGEGDVARAWQRLGTDERRLTAAWQADLQERLG